MDGSFLTTAALVGALTGLPAANRALALTGLLRSETRTGALLVADANGAVKPQLLGAGIAKGLKESNWEPIRKRANELPGR